MSIEKWNVGCSRCNYSETVNSQAEAESWKCVHEQRPPGKLFSILHHCSNGHKPFWAKRGEGCLECEKDKIKKKAERLLPFWQSEARLTTSKEHVPQAFELFQKAQNNVKAEKKAEREDLANLIADKIAQKINVKLEPEIIANELRDDK